MRFRLIVPRGDSQYAVSPALVRLQPTVNVGDYKVLSGDDPMIFAIDCIKWFDKAQCIRMNYTTNSKISEWVNLPNIKKIILKADPTHQFDGVVAIGSKENTARYFEVQQ